MGEPFGGFHCTSMGARRVVAVGVRSLPVDNVVDSTC